MPVDRLLVKQRLALISTCLTELEALSLLPREEFLNARTAASAESFLRRALEAVFDIGRHILAKNGGTDMAMEYKGIALGLGRMGIVTADLQLQLVKMAGYRNRLVHLYHQVSNDELHEIIRTDLDDIRRFKDQILAYISG
ncbi:MAG: DUF86 domain-containing protein [Firmicutes bacterium]|nr:DUF86 domain-containing protein [Bacillota bacterium]